MKIYWHDFMDDPDELHAFVIGFCEILCPWPPRHSTNSTNSEYHYYLFGRGMGVIAWIIIAKIIQVVFW